MTWLRTFPVTRDANSRTWMSKKPDRKSVSTLLEEEDVLIFGNGSVNDSDGWNATEVPINISVVTEAVNVSEDLLEDDNESTELDGNLSEENITEASNSNNSSTTAEDVDVLITWNESANDSVEQQTEENVSEVSNSSNDSWILREDVDVFITRNESANDSNDSWILREDVDVLITRNESANDSDASDGWNETEPPLNISVVTEAINVSEDLLEDDNESTELDGNMSDANLASGWNETEPPINMSNVTEPINVSEDLLEDDNESTELDGNLSDANQENLTEEGVPTVRNESAIDSDGWNDTELPMNVSNVTEAINVSEDLLEDDNESTAMDGNVSDAKLASVSLPTSWVKLVVAAWF
eukprot:s8232_g1.t2